MRMKCNKKWMAVSLAPTSTSSPSSTSDSTQIIRTDSDVSGLIIGAAAALVVGALGLIVVGLRRTRKGTH